MRVVKEVKWVLRGCVVGLNGVIGEGAGNERKIDGNREDQEVLVSMALDRVVWSSWALVYDEVYTYSRDIASCEGHVSVSPLQ